jgi:hypothetical protein
MTLYRPQAEEHRSAGPHTRFHRHGPLRCVSKQGATT